LKRCASDYIHENKYEDGDQIPTAAKLERHICLGTPTPFNFRPAILNRISLSVHGLAAPMVYTVNTLILDSLVPAHRESFFASGRASTF
jgi:hypothetical protein